MSMFPVILPDGRPLVGAPSNIAQLMARELARLPPVFVSPSRPFGELAPELDLQVGRLLVGRTVWRDRWYARWSGDLNSSSSSAARIDVVRLDLLESDRTWFHTQLKPEEFADWSDALPFLEAIAEDPADRLRRLVYADFLEDQGMINAAGSLRELISNPPLWWATWWQPPSAASPRMRIH